jgi:hypothetical protein
LAQSYSVDWHTVAAGGGMSANSQYVVSGTIGQPATCHLTGGSYMTDGGFWAFATIVQAPGAPLLSIRATATNTIALSWPSPSEGFILQSSANLTATNWSAVSLTPSDDGTTKTLIWLNKSQAGSKILFRFFHGSAWDLTQWTVELAEAAINDG